MCGITGFWGLGSRLPLDKIAESMAARIVSRGPDDFGVWSDADIGFCLAHRRLAVIDLSPAGHQPMVSPCGRFVLAYNGEIYNHSDLRDDLERQGGHFVWRGHSDTETLLAAIRHWGLEVALSRLNGMFAFALWDRAERTLTLARDRMGEKPLYYGASGDTFLFGSELKALRAHPAWCSEVDRNALALYMRHSCVPAPFSIYRGIRKLPAASFVVVRDSGKSASDPVCYWDLARIAEGGSARAIGDHLQLTDELDSLLRDAVKRRMAADVPLGAFLSGGYDSTSVVAMMQAQSVRPVKTFTMGFHESGYNEAHHASAVAKHLGTDHTECYVTPEQAMAVIPKLPNVYDEPFSDVSQIPTYLVSELARQSVTVSLSGDGGDELFGGYNRHIVGPEVWRNVVRLPFRLRRSLGVSMGWLAQRNLDHFTTWVPQSHRFPDFSGKLEKLASALQARDGLAFYRDLVSNSKAPEQFVIDAIEPATLLTRPDCLPSLPGLFEQMMYLDMMTYLPDDILTKVDRASMAVSLEARVPMLDHRLVEFAWRVPTECKVRHGRGKWLLRQVLYRYVPRSLLERPKMGFAVPIDRWLRGPLRDWGEDLLDEKRMDREGFLIPAPIRAMWDQHINGKRGYTHQLWGVLMFQAWLAEQR